MRFCDKVPKQPTKCHFHKPYQYLDWFMHILDTLRRRQYGARGFEGRIDFNPISIHGFFGPFIRLS
jgi:hypothetical protein